MIALTIALVYYARVTIKEGNKARRADSIERQLETFYNPMYEIMTEAVEQQNAPEKTRGIVRVGQYEELDEMFLKYSHYLKQPTDQHKVRQLLLFPKKKGYEEGCYPDKEFKDCLTNISVIRARLWIDYQELTGSPIGAILEKALKIS